MITGQSEISRQNEAWKAARSRILRPVKVDTKDSLRLELAVAKAFEAQARKDIQRLLMEVERQKIIAENRLEKIAGLEAFIEKMREKPSTNRYEYPTVDGIITKVLENYPEASWDRIIGKNRSQLVQEPRQACIVAVYLQRPDLSFPDIGRIFFRDHTSIMHIVRKHGVSRSLQPNENKNEHPEL